jgi:hypothetical protein
MDQRRLIHQFGRGNALDRSQTQPAYAGPRQTWTRPGFVVAAAFLGLACVAGLGAALFSPSPPDRDSRSTGNPRTAPGGVDPAAAGPSTVESTRSGGPPGPVTTTVPTRAPDGVTWQLLGQVALPYSATAGPYRVTKATASGYEHSPTGALIAVAQLVTRASSTSGRPVWEPTITDQFVPGADRDRLLSALRGQPDDRPEPGELAQIAGFIYQSYSPDTAVIGLTMRGDKGFYVGTITTQWRDGDWRLIAPPGGSWASLVRRINDLTGVVEWGAT